VVPLLRFRIIRKLPQSRCKYLLFKIVGGLRLNIDDNGAPTPGSARRSREILTDFCRIRCRGGLGLGGRGRGDEETSGLLKRAGENVENGATENGACPPARPPARSPRKSDT